MLESSEESFLVYEKNQESSAVYGMPKAAFEIGAVQKQTGLENIVYEIFKNLKNNI